MDVCCNSLTGRTLDCSGRSSEGIDSCKDVYEIRCGTEEGERPVRRISDNSPTTAMALHSMGGSYGWDCVDRGGCAQCKGRLNDSMVLYAMGFKFCSEGCRCTFISEMNDDFAGDGRGLELEGTCPCLPGDDRCPHRSSTPQRLQRNGGLGFENFVVKEVPYNKHKGAQHIAFLLNVHTSTSG